MKRHNNKVYEIPSEIKLFNNNKENKKFHKICICFKVDILKQNYYTESVYQSQRGLCVYKKV